jgi:hypothetical protein
VLGNKCATVYFKETIVLGFFFGMVISNMSVFLQHSIYHRTAAASFSVAMGGGGSLHAPLEVEGALGQQAACQL